MAAQQMFVDRKPFIYLWRPFYRIVVRGLLLPVLDRIRLFMIFEPMARLAAMEEENRRLSAQLARMEQTTKEQWRSMEQLLLCVLRDPGTTGWIPEPLEGNRRAQADRDSAN